MTFDKLISKRNINYIESSKQFFELQPVNYEVVDNNEALKNILLSDILLGITNDDFTRRTNLAKKQQKMTS